MIELTLTDGKTIWINPDHIVSIAEANNGGADVYILMHPAIFVSESPDQVIESIGLARRASQRAFTRGFDALIQTLHSANGAFGRIAWALEEIANQ